MVLNVILKYTHEKQAAKFAQEKLSHKPHPFGLSVSYNLNLLQLLSIVLAQSPAVLLLRYSLPLS